MRVWKRLLALCCLVCVALPSSAVAPAVVDAVRMPAWLERDGASRPAAVGDEVHNGDRVRTGDGARVYLRLAEGSTVKLGENAQIGVYSRSLKPQTVFKGALEVATGAFRFTTDRLSRVKARELSVRVGTATIGIRGTDVWGKSGPDRDLVMLIEGRVEVRHAGGEAVELAQSLATFVAPKGAAPLPVVLATEAELRTRARETEIEVGDGASRRGGLWKLVLAAAVGEAEALAAYDAAHTAGFAARIVPRGAEGGWSYDAVIRGFVSEAEAQAAAARLKVVAKLPATVAR